MNADSTTVPLDPIRKETYQEDRQWIQVLARHFDAREINHSRRMQEALRGADQASELPSVAEVLTIQQFGYPRTYNLNDGMGPDSLF